MSSNHLSEDQLKYVISADSSQAQQELHKLEKETSSLRSEERKRHDAMVALEAAGKKNSEEYRRLGAECKEYSSKIRDNEKQMRSMRTAMDTSSMTMNELKKHSKDLHRELDNMSQAANPAEYAKLESRLKDVDGRISELKQNVKGFREFASSDVVNGVFFGNMLTKFADFCGNMIANIKNTVSESIHAGLEMAESADGITHAFRQLNKPDLLDGLRKATNGTLNDVQLMKAAVKANDLQVPLDNLGKYLEFARIQARNTGQSVDELTDKIVTGLGKQTAKPFLQLGISAGELNSKIKETGSFMTAISDIVDTRLAKSANDYVSASEKASQRTVALQNAQRALGEELLPVKEKFDETYNDMQIHILSAVKYLFMHRDTLIVLGKAVVVLTATYLAYVAGQKLAYLWNLRAVAVSKLKAAADAVENALLELSILRHAVLNKTMTASVAIQKAFNVVLKLSPWGLVLGGITLVVSALLLFRKRTDAAAMAQKSLDNIRKAASESIEEEKTKIEMLTRRIHNNTLSLNERKQAISDLQKIVPDYTAKIDAEGKVYAEATDKLAEYNAELERKALIEGAQDELKKLGQQRAQLEIKKKQKEADLQQLQQEQKNYNVNNSGKPQTSGGAVPASSYYATMNYSANIRATRNEVQGLNKDIDGTRSAIDAVGQVLSENQAKVKKKKSKVKNTVVNTSNSHNTNTSSNTPNPDDTAASVFSSSREKDLAAAKQSYQDDLNTLNDALANKKITQEKFDTLMVAIKVNHQQDLLDIEKLYQQKALTIEIKDAGKKSELQQEQDKNVTQADQESKDAQLEATKQYYDSISEIQSMSAKETTPTLQQELDAKLLALETYYKTSLERARLSGQSEADVTKAYEEVKSSIKAEYAKKELEQQNADKEKINQEKQQLGLVSQKQIYDQELAQLRQHLSEVHATEEESAKAVTDLKCKQWKEQFDYYSQMFSSSFTSLQDAELAVVDAKYDAELQSAKGNSEKTEMLEKKKANAELKVKKKYADVNFAMTASQIAANTASGVARQFSDLPLAAAIATGALVSIAGTAQLVAANAEREKVKKMTLESTGSSSSSSGARVATGRESGGSIDVRREQDGKLFHAQYDPEKRGYVDRPTVIVGEGSYGQSKEWIASNAALNNPTVAPLISIIDQHQRAGNLQMLDMNKYLIQQQHRGLSVGGSVSPITYPPNNSPTAPSELITRLYDLLDNIRNNGIPATVALDDFDAKVKLRDQARKIASK